MIRITGLFMTVLWSRYLQCLYFFRGGVSRGQGTKSKEIFPSSAAQSFLIKGGGKDRVFPRRATLVPAAPRFIIKVRNRSYLRRFSDCEFAKSVTRVRPLQSSKILDNLCGNCRSARASKLLPSNFSATDLTRICTPVGDEVAPFSAARQSAHLGTNAFTSPRSFGCGYAGLGNMKPAAETARRSFGRRIAFCLVACRHAAY